MAASEKYNIYLIGPMGAGKTSIGRHLARKLGLEFYDSDHVVEERTGASIPWIYDIEGEEGFQLREKKIITELVKLHGILLATGGGTVVIPENREELAKHGVIIYLKTSLNDQIERIKHSKKRPLATAKDARRNSLKEMRMEREPIYESLANIVCDTDSKTLHSATKEILQALHDKYQIEPKE